MQPACSSVSARNCKSAEGTGPLVASTCSTMPGAQRACSVHLCAAMPSQPPLLIRYHAAAWLLRRTTQSSLTRSLFLLTLPEPYHLLSCLFLAFTLASISSKEITSKVSLVLVTSYFITSVQRAPFTITTPITCVMAELRIWCDTCKERAAEEASSLCSNR